MTLYALGDPTYQKSNWYNNILKGLIDIKRQKRFSLMLLNELEDLEKIEITDEDALFVIGTNSTWLQLVIPKCESYFQNRVIVLGNHNSRNRMGQYSVVTQNISHDIQLLYTYLASYNRKNIALYGINPESTSDAFRKECFLALGNNEENIFYNVGSLTKCCEHFLSKSEKYNAVICANDYAAISLIRFFKNNPSFFVTSCGGGLLLTHYFSPKITHTLVDYTAFGKAGLALYQILIKNRDIHSINVYLTSHLSIGETTNNLPLQQEPVSTVIASSKAHDVFYSDTEVDEMLRVEMLLNKCDDTDFCIINSLLEGMTYAQISDKIFMSVNGIKYKLKSMFQICHVSSKAEFIELLKKYIFVR